MLAGLAASALAVALLGPCEIRMDDPNRVSGVGLHEDDPGWDCHTMGNRVCGP